jgi:hypothetical protein
MKFPPRISPFLPVLVASLILSCSSCRRPLSTISPDLDEELTRLGSLSPAEIPDVLRDLDREDEIMKYYRDEATQGQVIRFFAELSGSERTAKVILESAERSGVSASLAFALALEESDFDARAVHHNTGSIDRGLFQLNSKTFPELSEAEFFDPAVNARLGVEHLKYCLSSGGNEVSALAMYNAGRTRVSGNGTPKKTLDYVYRILKYQENIGSLFAARVVARSDQRFAAAFRR